MKKLIILSGLILISIFTSACTQVKTSEEPYTFKGESNISVGDRNFILEDIPKSIAEETVMKHFLYTITADFDSKHNILADIEPHKISIESEKKQFKDGVYTQSYKIHKISTLTEKEYNSEENPLHYYGWNKVVDEYNLSDYKIVNVDYTKKLSEKAIERGPQWGDGTYNRSFIVGKTSKDNSYKIFDFGMQ